jgi:hypothetical protein
MYVLGHLQCEVKEMHVYSLLSTKTKKERRQRAREDQLKGKKYSSGVNEVSFINLTFQTTNVSPFRLSKLGRWSNLDIHADEDAAVSSLLAARTFPPFSLSPPRKPVTRQNAILTTF